MKECIKPVGNANNSDSSSVLIPPSKVDGAGGRCGFCGDPLSARHGTRYSSALCNMFVLCAYCTRMCSTCDRTFPLDHIAHHPCYSAPGGNVAVNEIDDIHLAVPEQPLHSKAEDGTCTECQSGNRVCSVFEPDTLPAFEPTDRESQFGCSNFCCYVSQNDPVCERMCVFEFHGKCVYFAHL